MRLYEFELNPATTKLSFWDIVKQLGLDTAAKTFHDATLPWINNNQPACIAKLMKKKAYHELSLLQLFFALEHPYKSWGTKNATLAEFEAFKTSPITLWRAGAGKYDTAHQGAGWFSYTFKRERANTFFKYEATYASKAYKLPDRKGPAWIIELTIPAHNIALYLSASTDSEVIVPANTSATAKLIKQT
jgi:hypothetical protein